MTARYVAILLAGALVAAPVSAVKMSLTEDEASICEEQGGCTLVTNLWLQHQIAAAKATTCQKGLGT